MLHNDFFMKCKRVIVVTGWNSVISPPQSLTAVLAGLSHGGKKLESFKYKYIGIFTLQMSNSCHDCHCVNFLECFNYPVNKCLFPVFLQKS